MELVKYSEVVGLPVISSDNGKKIGLVKDIIFCPGEKNILAFLLERNRYQINGRVILYKDVLALGKDALIIKDSLCAVQFKKAEDAGEFKERGNIKGLRIYSRSGVDLGVAEDVLLDYKTGMVEGVITSCGLFQDILQGRNILPLFGKVEFSDESILVDKEAVDEMTDTGGGLKNKVFHSKNDNVY